MSTRVDEGDFAFTDMARIMKVSQKNQQHTFLPHLIDDLVADFYGGAVDSAECTNSTCIFQEIWVLLLYNHKKKKEMKWRMNGLCLEKLTVVNNVYWKAHGHYRTVATWQVASCTGSNHRNRPFAQLWPGLETGHPVTVGQSPAYDFSVSDEQKAVFLVSVSTVLLPWTKKRTIWEIDQAKILFWSLILHDLAWYAHRQCRGTRDARLAAHSLFRRVGAWLDSWAFRCKRKCESGGWDMSKHAGSDTLDVLAFVVVLKKKKPIKKKRPEVVRGERRTSRTSKSNWAQPAE